MHRLPSSGSSNKLVENIVRAIGIPKAKLLDIWAMPNSDAISLAQSIAGGYDPGYPVVPRGDFPLVPPGSKQPSPEEKLQIKTCKILVDRVFRGNILRHFGAMKADEVMSNITITGLEHVKDAVRTGRGVCLLNSHVGPGQLAPLILSREGYDITSLGSRDLYQDVGLKNLDRIKVIPMKDAFHTQLIASGVNVLRSGGILHTTGDGFSGLGNRKQAFLGKWRPVQEGYAYMAVTANAATIPVFVKINMFGQLSITFHPALSEMQVTASRSDKIDHIVEQYWSLLEKYWRTSFDNIKISLTKKQNKFNNIQIAMYE